MKATTIIIGLLLTTSGTIAQTTDADRLQEAQKRLAERQTAAIQTSLVEERQTSAKLRVEVAQLRKELADTRAELAATNTELNKQKATAKATIVTPPKPEIKPDFNVEVKEDKDLTTILVTFRTLPTTEDAAAKIVRKELERVAAKGGRKEILAMAFNTEDDALADEIYGGPLTYDPKDKTIATMDERRGLKTVSKDHGSYFVQTKDGRTADGILPVRKWLTCTIVFPNQPTSEQFKTAAMSEINTVKSRHLDTAVFAYVGDSANSITWKQVKAANGRYMNIDYRNSTGLIVSN